MNTSQVLPVTALVIAVMTLGLTVVFARFGWRLAAEWSFDTTLLCLIAYCIFSVANGFA